MKQYLTFTDEVRHALDNNLPVVALETTIISHGMPYPQNIEMAKEVEQIIRDNGAVPATIGIMDGKIKIGLSESELEEFATNKSVEKVSRRDFPYILASGKIRATTVSRYDDRSPAGRHPRFCHRRHRRCSPRRRNHLGRVC